MIFITLDCLKKKTNKFFFSFHIAGGGLFEGGLFDDAPMQVPSEDQPSTASEQPVPIPEPQSDDDDDDRFAAPSPAAPR